MKTLLLLRHAKSDWGDDSLKDFDRPLAARGARDAPRMGMELKRRGPLPDYVLSSPAVRARETVAAVNNAAGTGVNIDFDEAIYDASSAELMKVIRRLPDSAQCVLLVGHNPGFEDLLARLIGHSEAMKTCALACLSINVERWQEVEDGLGDLKWLLTPKQFSE